MNDKIKEKELNYLLEEIKDTTLDYVGTNGCKYQDLLREELNLLLDYITNLQQENQELNDSITWWNNRFNAVQRDYEDYKSRIEKAVEYIKEHIRIDDEYPDYMEMLIEEKDELLNILNGRSDE